MAEDLRAEVGRFVVKNRELAKNLQNVSEELTACKAGAAEVEQAAEAKIQQVGEVGRRGGGEGRRWGVEVRVGEVVGEVKVQ